MAFVMPPHTTDNDAKRCVVHRRLYSYLRIPTSAFVILVVGCLGTRSGRRRTFVKWAAPPPASWCGLAIAQLVR